MLRTELEEKTEQLENWQWEMANYVYQNHDSIDNVEGKNQIAAIIRDGFSSDSAIRKMYAELGNAELIKYDGEDMFSTWQVNHRGYIVNTQPKKVEEVVREALYQFSTDYPELYAKLDYIQLETAYVCRDKQNADWIEESWLAVYYVTGGSEGYYVHVETVAPRQMVMLGKTLLEGNAGRVVMEQTCAALSRIFHV